MEPEPEPNRESSVDENSLENDLETENMDETSSAGSGVGNNGEGQNVRVPIYSSPNFRPLQHGNCRICFAPATTSGEDPILELGCQCRDDLRFSHKSCLKEWFVRRMLRHGTLDCEVCRAPLAARVELLVLSRIQARIYRPYNELVPRIFLLLQVPPEELDRLQVPLDTPDFYELPPEVGSSLSASFRVQEEEHRNGEERRSADYMIAHNNLGPLQAHELQARVGRVAELHDQVIIFEENTNEQRDTSDHDMDTDGDAVREVLHGKRIIRVDVNQGFPSGQELWRLLDDLSLNINLLGANTREEMWFVPSSMYNFDLSLAHYNPPRISAEGVIHRQYTYGRFGRFALHNMAWFM